MIFATFILNCLCALLYGTLSRCVYLCMLSVLYQVVETLHLAYTTFNMLAFWIVLIGYTPFMVSLLRVGWRDSQKRRLILFRTFYKTCFLSFFVDAWMHCFTEVFSEELCRFTDYKPKQDIVVALIRKYGIQVDVGMGALFMSLCDYRLNMNRMVFTMTSHLFAFFPIIWMSWGHVKEKKKRMIVEEQKFVARLITRRLSPRDWAQAMLETRFIKLTVGSNDPARFATLGAILIEKEISKAKNFRRLYHRCSSPHSEMLFALLIVRLALRHRAGMP